MSRFLPVLAALIASQCLLGEDAFSAEITAECSEHGAIVKIDGQLFTEYVVSSGGKPILWPIIGPTGKPMTRDYPMHDRPGEARDHIHHRSLWFAHGNVNGIDFWLESPGKAGIIKHRTFAKVSSGKPATIVAQNDWVAPDGKRVCEDQRSLRFDTDGDARWIDFDIAIRASDGPVTFGDTKEGMFAVRVAEPMRVDAKHGGQIVNRRGQIDGAAWGQTAPWADYHGPVNGQTVGIAIFNHPSSFRFPTYWHVRTYGLFAANPFGVRAFTDGKAASGTFELAKNERLTLRYRVFLHRGTAEDGKVAEAYAVYSKEAR